MYFYRNYDESDSEVDYDSDQERLEELIARDRLLEERRVEERIRRAHERARRQAKAQEEAARIEMERLKLNNKSSRDDYFDSQTRANRSKDRPGNNLSNAEAWVSHESKWQAFKVQRIETLTFDCVPWPPSTKGADIIQGAFHVWRGGRERGVDIVQEKKKEVLLELIKRWHPDRWSTLIRRVIQKDRNRVLEKVEEISKEINTSRSDL